MDVQSSLYPLTPQIRTLYGSFLAFLVTSMYDSLKQATMGFFHVCSFIEGHCDIQELK
jgi:hypothetical protein